MMWKIILIILIFILLILVAVYLNSTLFVPLDKILGGHQNDITLDKLIIHIGGASGSGKTTIGKEIKEKYGDHIIVKDIDDLRHEFIQKYYGKKEWGIIDKDAYQKYIDEYINNMNSPIIFVGLNVMPWWHPGYYYNLHQKYKFYIDLDDDELLRRKCKRLLLNVVNDENAMNDLIEDNNKFIKLLEESINNECNLKETHKMNKTWRNDYEKQGYKIASYNDVFDQVNDILYSYNILPQVLSNDKH